MKKTVLASIAAMILGANTAQAHGTYHQTQCNWVSGYSDINAAAAAIVPGRQFSTTSLPAETKDVKIWGQWADPGQGRQDGAGTYYGESDVEIDHGMMRGFLGRPGHGKDNGVPYVLVALTQRVADRNMPQASPDQLPANMVAGLCVAVRDDHAADGG